MINNNIYKKINIKDVPSGIDTYVVSNAIIEYESNFNYSLFDKYSSAVLRKKSFLRTRILINKLNLNEKSNISISHVDNISIVSVSNKYKIGVDIERSSRKIAKRTRIKIIDKNKNLKLKPLQIWTLMESTYKCLQCKGEHFLKYIFSKQGKRFTKFGNNYNVYSVTNDIDGYTLGIAFAIDY